MTNSKLFAALLVLILAARKDCLSAPSVEPLASLEEQVKKNPDDNAAWNRIADAHLRLLGSTGQLSHLSQASNAVEKSLKIANPAFNKAALALRTRVEMSSHRFIEGRRSAEQLRGLMQDGTYPLELLGDALFNLGDYAEAEAAWSKVPLVGNELAMEPRLSQLDWIHGNVAGARQRLDDASHQAEKFASQFPEIAAWCHVQIGELAFRSGDWEAAESHYQRALLQQPDYYSGLDHLAELKGAQGKLEEATALYLRLIERVDRPEFLQALGDLYLFAGKKDEAKVWHDRALAGYLDSVKRGEPLYDHHLAGLYADSLNQPEAAVESARRDFALRHSIQTYDALAWALFKAGKNEEAREFASKALATGVLDAHILYHAGMIRMGSGDIPGGTAALQNAMKANPRYSTFHVHR